MHVFGLVDGDVSIVKLVIKLQVGVLEGVAVDVDELFVHDLIVGYSRDVLLRVHLQLHALVFHQE